MGDYKATKVPRIDETSHNDTRPIEHGYNTVHAADIESSIPLRGVSPIPIVGKNVEESNLYYKLNDGRKKIAVIFNNFKFTDKNLKELLGSEKDCERMKNCLINTLGFEVNDYKNPTKLEVHKAIDKLSNMTSSDVSCIVVVVMTHGHRGGRLSAVDLEYEKDLLFDPFTRESTKLGGVPKIFFIQACRGAEVDDGVRHNGPDDRMPSHADIFVLYSAVEGYKSFVRANYGSWMIQEVCNQLETLPSRKKHKWHLLELMTFAIARVAVAYKSNTYDPAKPKTLEEHNKKAMPQIESTLTKLLNFSL